MSQLQVISSSFMEHLCNTRNTYIKQTDRFIHLGFAFAAQASLELLPCWHQTCDPEITE